MKNSACNLLHMGFVLSHVDIKRQKVLVQSSSVDIVKQKVTSATAQ